MRVYVTAHAPRYPGQRVYDGTRDYSELRAYAPNDGALVGRHPVPDLSNELLIGSDRIVALAGTVIVLAPPPLP